MNKRVVIIYTIFILCFMLVLVRMIDINKSDYTEVIEKQSTRTLTVGEKRGEIYDRNFQPLVNCENRLLSVITPCVQSYQYLKNASFSEDIAEKIENGYPFMVESDAVINNELIRTFSVPERYSGDGLACHIIGYLNYEGDTGVSGIEKAYNEYLSKNSGTLKVSFEVDALGRVMAGMKKTVTDNNFSSKAGVVLTIDKKFQQITETALENSKIESGCAVVMHVDTGEILALASVPKFDQNNLAKAMTEENSPFVNKALQSYSAGSVFKSLISAAAIENGYNIEIQYECTGEIKVGDTVYHCYDNKAHGKVDMKTALGFSCNTYFINLINQIDVDYLLSLCKKLNLGQSYTLCSSITTSSGALPEENDLKQKGELSNFAFGQGRLLVTPIQMLSIYHTLATGNYAEPSLIMGLTNQMGLMTSLDKKTSVKILSDETVAIMRELLSDVVENGNATEAKSSLLSLAGKTGTAESGIYKDGKQLLRTWFAGFFPAGKPHYVVVVLNENGTSGNGDCGGVFREICEKMVGY